MCLDLWRMRWAIVELGASTSDCKSIAGCLPRPSSYPLLGPQYLLSGTIYPHLRVQGGSWILLQLDLSAQARRFGELQLQAFASSHVHDEQPQLWFTTGLSDVRVQLILQSKLLNGGYIGDNIGDYYRGY